MVIQHLINPVLVVYCTVNRWKYKAATVTVIITNRRPNCIYKHVLTSSRCHCQKRFYWTLFLSHAKVQRRACSFYRSFCSMFDIKYYLFYKIITRTAKRNFKAIKSLNSKFWSPKFFWSPFHPLFLAGHQTDVNFVANCTKSDSISQCRFICST
jgi:hypothetical protein